VVIGGSLLTYVVNLYLSQGIPAPQVLALQWGPIPLDLGGNLVGLGFLDPFVVVLLPLRVALTAWTIFLILGLPFRIRSVVRAGVVYLAGGAVTTLGLAISYAWGNSLSEGNVSTLTVWLFNLFLPCVAVLLAGVLTPLLVKQFLEVSLREVLGDPGHWAMVAVAYLIWSAGNYIDFFWPTVASYGSAFVLLAVQSLATGAIFVGAAGPSEVSEGGEAEPAGEAS
jgi:voltage-gated potassium channel Kch